MPFPDDAIESADMRRVARYQVRLGTLVVIAAIPALAWWPIFQFQEWAEQRRIDFQALADFHADMTNRTRAEIAYGYENNHTVYMLMTNGRCLSPRPQCTQSEADRWREQCEAVLAYHVALNNKYWWAARFPTLPVSSDPPRPPEPE